MKKIHQLCLGIIRFKHFMYNLGLFKKVGNLSSKRTLGNFQNFAWGWNLCPGLRAGCPWGQLRLFIKILVFYSVSHSLTALISHYGLPSFAFKAGLTDFRVIR